MVITQHITEWGPFSVACTVGEYNDLSSYFIFPNPSTDWLMIDTDHERIDQLTIYSIDGRVQYYQENYVSGQFIQVSELISGLYIIEIANENMLSLLKFIRL